MNGQRFHSKIDALFYSMSALGVGLPLALGLYEVRDGRWLALVVAVALGGLVAGLVKTTYYLVDDQSLDIRCLVGTKKIPLRSISAIKPTHNPLSAPALSLDRLEVAYDGGFALVSPADKAGFVEAIRRAQPAVVVGPADGERSSVLWLAVGGAILPMCVVAVMMYANSRPPNVTVTPSMLTVSGSFGVTVPMRDVTDVSLQDEMPRVVRKRFGSDGFTALRGRFELAGIGDGQLYVHRSARPYVLIRTRDRYVYINYPERERTQALFEELKRARASASDTGTSTILR